MADHGDQYLLVFHDLPIVDESEATLRANEIHDLDGQLAVTSESVGIEQPGGIFKPLVRKGTIIPVTYTQVLATSQNGQKELDLFLYRGTGGRVDENRLIGKARIVGILPAVAGQPRIEVTLKIQRHGDLLISARNLANGDSLRIKLID